MDGKKCNKKRKRTNAHTKRRLNSARIIPEEVGCPIVTKMTDFV